MDNSAKILLLGKTGVGKSSFINYFLGKTVAKCAAGKPVTPDFISYEIEEGRYPIKIFDTKGIEAIGACNQLEQIINVIKQKNNSDDIFNWFHTIFYCISMSNPRFEEFEVNFIRRLQRELTQHIHIIITHCDAVTPEKVAAMRSNIVEKLGSMENIEIFEVVCISKKKANGKVVKPYGKEKISERVFDLLLEDISHKLSSDYATTLWYSIKKMADYVFSELDDFIDETVKIGILFRMLMDNDETMDRIENRMDEVFDQLDENIENIQKQTDEKFTKILRPAAQLYTSYRGVTMNSYVRRADLAFSDVAEWIDVDWMDKIDENALMARVFPRVANYMGMNGDISGENSISELLGIIRAGAIDLFSLKKNLKNLIQELHDVFLYTSIPDVSEIQEKACKRIVEFIKPNTVLEDGEIIKCGVKEFPEEESDNELKDENLDDDLMQQIVDDMMQNIRNNNVAYNFGELLRNGYEQKKNECMNTLCVHLGKDIVFTGIWGEVIEREVENSELLEGEINAFVTDVGGYTVRSAERLYRDDDNVRYTERVPVSHDVVDAYLSDANGKSNDYRKVLEISAKYKGNKYSECWQHICLATSSISMRWFEEVSFICTVKDNDLLSDDQSSLFVLKEYMGDSFSVEHWYRLTPEGMVNEYRIHPYDSDSFNRLWID